MAAKIPIHCAYVPAAAIYFSTAASKTHKKRGVKNQVSLPVCLKVSKLTEI